jgi:hypothetical protein
MIFDYRRATGGVCLKKAVYGPIGTSFTVSFFYLAIAAALTVVCFVSISKVMAGEACPVAQVSLMRLVLAHPVMRFGFNMASYTFDVSTKIETELSHLQNTEAKYQSLRRKITLLTAVYDAERKKQMKILSQAEIKADTREVKRLNRLLDRLEERFFLKKRALKSEAAEVAAELNRAEYLTRYSDMHYRAEMNQKLQAGTWESVLFDVADALSSAGNELDTGYIFNADLPDMYRLGGAIPPATNPYKRLFNESNVSEETYKDLSRWVDSREWFLERYLAPGCRQLFVKGVPDITATALDKLHERTSDK